MFLDQYFVPVSRRLVKVHEGEVEVDAEAVHQGRFAGLGADEFVLQWPRRKVDFSGWKLSVEV